MTEFARKTGDLRSLSTTDIRVVALVYTLEKEFIGTDHIRTEPTNKVPVLCTACYWCIQNKLLIASCWLIYRGNFCYTLLLNFTWCGVSGLHSFSRRLVYCWKVHSWCMYLLGYAAGCELRKPVVTTVLSYNDCTAMTRSMKSGFVLEKHVLPWNPVNFRKFPLILVI